MGKVETDNVKFVLTSYGKEQGFKHGLLNVMKYFTVSDDGVMYTINVQPDSLNDINGCHTTSTNIASCSKNTIE